MGVIPILEIQCFRVIPGFNSHVNQILEKYSTSRIIRGTHGVSSTWQSRGVVSYYSIHICKHIFRTWITWDVLISYVQLFSWTLIKCCLTLIGESWKKIPNATVTERVFRKSPERSIGIVYICVLIGIFPLILPYAIWNKHNQIAQLTIYLHR